MNMNTLVLPIVRHLLQLAAGYLIAKGFLDPGNAETLMGGLLAILTVAWWFFTKPSAKASEVARQVDKRVSPNDAVVIKTPPGVPDIVVAGTAPDRIEMSGRTDR